MPSLRAPQKSLRSLLMFLFLLFSVVPLFTVTGYSYFKYTGAIDQELEQRLVGNFREIVTIMAQYEGDLTSVVQSHAQDNSLAFYLSQNKIDKARALARNWLASDLAHRLSIFNKKGLQEISLVKDERGVRRLKNLEGGDLYLSEKFLEKVDSEDRVDQIEIRKGKSLDLISFAKIRNSRGRLVGYIEEIIEFDKGSLEALKKRMNLEIVFFTPIKSKKPNPKTLPIVASHDDLELYRPNFFADQTGQDGSFELNLREVPHEFLVRPIRFGGQRFYIALGTSKQAVNSALEKVNTAFFWVVFIVLAFLIVLSVVISKILLKPVSDLLDAIHGVKPGEEIPEVKSGIDNELGQLADSFNDLSRKVNSAQTDLRAKIKELEAANKEITDTQSKLVHSAKMASLGQLVAGIAHELNNPIGFIFSNMGHLREYSDNLIKLTEEAEKDSSKIPKLKKEIEYDYIVKDMPKLIASCEDGARRTRDIVMGLRNFSRLEEAKIEKMNIEDSLDNTLNLLSGELKNRIEIEKNYGGIPQVKCYPSQLNQVFMNILSNAAQAIHNKGTITITTEKLDKKKVQISVADTGKGMDPKTAEQVFDPFFTTKTLGKGTGLGLSISYGIVQKHGGDIIVESKKGKGTTFKIQLPI